MGFKKESFKCSVCIKYFYAALKYWNIWKIFDKSNKEFEGEYSKVG